MFYSLGDRGLTYSSGDFETTSLMALGCAFSLAAPVLASLYRGLNGIAHAAKPSYSQPFFSCHYLYGWLTHYFQTHYVLRPTPSSPLMVHYSGPPTRRNNTGDACKMVREGKVLDLRCLMLAKNCPEIILDERES